MGVVCSWRKPTPSQTNDLHDRVSTTSWPPAHDRHTCREESRSSARLSAPIRIGPSACRTAAASDQFPAFSFRCCAPRVSLYLFCARSSSFSTLFHATQPVRSPPAFLCGVLLVFARVRLCCLAWLFVVCARPTVFPRLFLVSLRRPFAPRVSCQPQRPQRERSPSPQARVEQQRKTVSGEPLLPFVFSSTGTPAGPPSTDLWRSRSCSLIKPDVLGSSARPHGVNLASPHSTRLHSTPSPFSLPSPAPSRSHLCTLLLLLLLLLL